MDEQMKPKWVKQSKGTGRCDEYEKEEERWGDKKWILEEAKLSFRPERLKLGDFMLCLLCFYLPQFRLGATNAR